MAGNDTAALIVAMEAKMDKFEKAMTDSTKMADKAVKQIEGRFAEMNKAIGAKFSELSNQFAGNAGEIGEALRFLGPAGIVAAAGLGATYLALEKVSEGSKAFRAYARQVKEAAATTGLTIPEVQAATDLFQRHGVEAEKSAGALAKFAISHHNAARGSGELFDALRRIDPQLAEQFAAARSTGAALDVLASAFRRVDVSTQAFLSRAAFGKGAAGMGPALLELAGRGGLGAVTDAAVQLGTAFDKEVIAKQALAAVEAERRSRITENNWNRAFNIIAEKWKDFKTAIGLGPENELKFSFTVRTAAEKLLDLDKRPVDSVTEELASVRKALAEERQRLAAAQQDNDQRMGISRSTHARVRTELPARENIAELARREKELLDEVVRRQQLEFEIERGKSDTSKDKDRLARIDILTREIERDKEHLALLGPLATAEQNRALQQKELNLALLQKKNISESEADQLKSVQALTALVETERKRLGVLGETATLQERIAAGRREIELQSRTTPNVSREEIERRQAADELKLRATDIGKRVQLGVGTEEERRTQFIAELNLKIAEGTAKEEDRARIMSLYNKTLKETIEQERERASALPGLTRLAQDAANPFKQADQFATSTFSNMENAFASVITKSKSLKDAIKDLTNSMLSDFAKLAFRQGTAPVLNALLGGGGAYAGTNIAGGPLGQLSVGPIPSASVFTGAEGGSVRGPGSSTSDSVHAMLSKGEFVVRAAMAEKYRGLLEDMNAGRMRHFAAGGWAMPRAPANIGPRGSSGVVLNMRINNTAANTHQVDTHEEPDGRGGRNVVLTFREMTAAAIGTPGSAANKSVLNLLGVRQRPRRRG